jgi:hypothetical protein
MYATLPKNWQKTRPIKARYECDRNAVEIRYLTDKIGGFSSSKKVEGEAFAMVSWLLLTSVLHAAAYVISRSAMKHFRRRLAR